MSGTELVDGWLDHFPEIVALVVVLAGLIFAWFARRAVAAVAPRVNRLALRWGAPPTGLLTPAFVHGLQLLVFWAILIASIIVGIRLMGGGDLTQRLDGLLGFASNLLIALGILAAGHILGLMARTVLDGVSGRAGAKGLGWIAYAIVTGVAAVTALRHLGLDLTFFSLLLLILFALFFFAITLTFALGARTLAANLAAQGELQRYKPGDRLQVDGVEGTIQEIHRTGLVLSNEQGLVNIPAARVAQSIVVMLHAGGEEDG